MGLAISGPYLGNGDWMHLDNEKTTARKHTRLCALGCRMVRCNYYFCSSCSSCGMMPSKTSDASA